MDNLKKMIDGSWQATPSITKFLSRKVISKKHSLPRQASIESAKHEKVIIIFSSHSLQMNDWGSYYVHYKGSGGSRNKSLIMMSLSFWIEGTLPKDLDLFWYLTFRQDTFRHGHFITGTFRHGYILSLWMFQQGDYLVLELLHTTTCDISAFGYFSMRTFRYRNILAYVPKCLCWNVHIALYGHTVVLWLICRHREIGTSQNVYHT